MEVLSIISNNNNKPRFKAKMQFADIRKLSECVVSGNIPFGIPKLYFLLKNLNEMPGDKAEFTNCMKNNQSQLSAMVHSYKIDSRIKNNQSQLSAIVHSYNADTRINNNQSQLSAMVHPYNTNLYQLLIDGVIAGEGANYFHALYNAVCKKNIKMIENFNKAWQININKTDKDLQEFEYKN